MHNTEKDVTTDPGPAYIPVADIPDPSERKPAHQWPVAAGLAADADTPEEQQPLRHPQLLMGEQPAVGSTDNPG
jgi:hypothetical protein